MQIKILWLVSKFLVGSSTPYNYIPIADNSDLEWNDKYDSDKWREKFKKCQDFLHSDNEAWHWCMNNE